MIINLIDDNILNVYRFGSVVYKTNQINSDKDYIIVTKEKVISDDINIHYFTVNEFQLLLDNHDIQMLECFFLNEDNILKNEHRFSFVLNKEKLRVSISTVASNSWVKGKKKLIVMADYDKYLAIKSIFHSLRILDFGIQIGANGKINNYSSTNFIFFDLLDLSNKFDNIELWNVIETKYKKLFNEKSTIFKSICPKPINESKIRLDLINLFKKYNIENIGLVDKVIKYFEDNGR
jgi:hypothetical protein